MRLIPFLQTELEEIINKTLDAVAACAPLMMLSKAKLHILTHLPQHIRLFGPAVLLSTERYKAFNHIFRLCSIHSN